MVPAPEPLRTAPEAPALPPAEGRDAPRVPAVHDRLTEYADQPPLLALRRLESSPRGLDEAEAQDRLLRRPPGEHARPRHWALQLLRTAANPFVLILIGLAAVSAVIQEGPSAVIIAFLALLSCALRFHQEYRSDRAAAALRAMVTSTATVLRRSSPGSAPRAREVPLDQVVPGDVVLLAPGDLVPADLRLLSSADLRVSQAPLTGESLPAGKHATLTAPPEPADPEVDLFDRAGLCFMGSVAVSGTGTALALATGSDTYFGATHRDLPREARDTAFDRDVRSVSLILLGFMLAAIPLVLLVTGLLRGEWPQALVFAIAVAVAITPEMLPLVVTMALVRGARSLARRQVIVKRLPAVHNLGAMDTLCTDKTGTLTLDKVTLACALDPLGRPDQAVLPLARANARWSAELTGQVVTDTIDEALLEHDAPEEPHGVAVIPFDFTRRRVTVVVRGDGLPCRDLLVTKGAVEDVLAVCSRVRIGGHELALDAAERARLTALGEAQAADGVRLLAVAVAERPALARDYRRSDERDLTLVGFVGFRDEPDPAAAETVAALARHGVGVVMVTGDHPLVARRVCRDAGLPAERVLTGPELDRLDDAALAAAARDVTVFARVGPQQKVRVVRALQASGRTVGYLGDGMNDAPALRAADVGISVRGAVDLARESSDVILARKDLLALERAVVQGRHTFGNAVKYIKISVSANLGNVLSMVVAGALLPFLPMLPVQVLVQNLFFDLTQLSLAYDRVDEVEVREPRGFQARDLVRFVLWTGPVGTLFDVATFGCFWWLLHTHGGAEGKALFHTGWFVENLLTQALAICLLRSRGRRQGARGPAKPVLLAAVAISLGGLALPYSPLASALGLTPLPMAALPLMTAVLLGYTITTVAVRSLYLRVFHRWL